MRTERTWVDWNVVVLILVLVVLVIWALVWLGRTVVLWLLLIIWAVFRWVGVVVLLVLAIVLWLWFVDRWGWRIVLVIVLLWVCRWLRSFIVLVIVLVALIVRALVRFRRTIVFWLLVVFWAVLWRVSVLKAISVCVMLWTYVLPYITLVIVPVRSVALVLWVADSSLVLRQCQSSPQHLSANMRDNSLAARTWLSRWARDDSESKWARRRRCRFALDQDQAGPLPL